MPPAKRSPQAASELRASLVEVAQRLVASEGAAALTMRTLATEAGCAVGLPYKVFASRDELVVELISTEFVELRARFDQLVADAGTGSVADNLGRYAELLLGSPAAALAHEIAHNEELSLAIDAKAGETGLVAALETTVADYLAAEKRLGRIDPEVDEQAFGFLVSGAVHNLLASGKQYPRPSQQQLEQMLAAVAARLVTPRPPEESRDGPH